VNAFQQAFPYLLLPSLWSARNRARRREKGDGVRAVLFGGIGLAVASTLFLVVFWLTWQLLDYEELGEYLLRLGLSWLFLTFLSFVTFSSIVTSLSTFFLSEDLRLLVAAPIPQRRLFHSRFAKTVAQAAWMVVVFMIPVLLAMGVVRCAPLGFYLAIPFTLLPFVLTPVAIGTMVTLVLVNVFPARRARDVLMLMGLLFAVALVMMLRFLRPERLLSIQSLPDITAFFTVLQSPVTPLLPSFWAGETLFAALQGRFDALHAGALWTTALAATIVTRIAFDRFYFSGWSKAQEARKARFARLRILETLAGMLPLPIASRALLVKDVKIFLRDTGQWSQLLLLLALTAVYVYNFKIIDLQAMQYVGGIVRNVYAFVNMAMAAFVLSAVAVRFVFPAVSIEGPAFWLVRTSPVTARSFLWSKFWTGLVPVLVLAETLTIVSNQLLHVDPFLKIVTAAAVFFMTFALVGLAAGMGGQYPRFSFENVTQVSGSYGGIAFMILAVLFILTEIGLVAWPSSVYLWHQYHGVSIAHRSQLLMAACFSAAAALSIATLVLPMRRGVAALERLGG
jgi:ABC-2 type transport system permease protein